MLILATKTLSILLALLCGAQIFQGMFEDWSTDKAEELKGKVILDTLGIF